MSPPSNGNASVFKERSGASDEIRVEGQQQGADSTRKLFGPLLITGYMLSQKVSRQR